jgi:hypothetical protein
MISVSLRLSSVFSLTVKVSVAAIGLIDATSPVVAISRQKLLLSSFQSLVGYLDAFVEQSL